jgi:hypothetical protein
VQALSKKSQDVAGWFPDYLHAVEVGSGGWPRAGRPTLLFSPFRLLGSVVAQERGPRTRQGGEAQRANEGESLADWRLASLQAATTTTTKKRVHRCRLVEIKRARRPFPLLQRAEPLVCSDWGSVPSCVIATGQPCPTGIPCSCIGSYTQNAGFGSPRTTELRNTPFGPITTCAV